MFYMLRIIGQLLSVLLKPNLRRRIILEDYRDDASSPASSLFVLVTFLLLVVLIVLIVLVLRSHGDPAGLIPPVA